MVNAIISVYNAQKGRIGLQRKQGSVRFYVGCVVSQILIYLDYTYLV